ncbi:MAG: Rib/alpha-like domain-containing protein, partial [Limosilactobacillus sp.]|uniref:Rib/alpha-like domain-containing protein n=1 Tax=Limosilactobacillus sp. TaxID=2773925 RepID=UPI002709A989|nr:Rib/alpha-like domain-containing protein [Limosilactobacillus sp.]
SKVTNMRQMFNYSGVQVLDLGNFDTSKVTDMAYMFSLMPNVAYINTTSFSAESLEDLNYMFSYDSNLQMLDLRKFLATLPQGLDDYYYSNALKEDYQAFIIVNDRDTDIPTLKKMNYARYQPGYTINGENRVMVPVETRVTADEWNKIVPDISGYIKSNIDKAITDAYGNKYTYDAPATFRLWTTVDLHESEASKYELKTKDTYEVYKGTEIGETELVENLSEFPTDVTWTLSGYNKDQVGQQTVTTTVTFKDGSKLSGTTLVTVKELADKYQLKTKDTYEVYKGTEIGDTELVENLSDFPEDVTWTLSGYDKDKVGTQTVTTTVTFSDGSSLSGTTLVTVKELSDKYQLKTKDTYEVYKGTEIGDTELVENLTDFPEDVTWKMSGYDKDKVGTQTVTTTVTFSDGSSLSGTTLVTVKELADKYNLKTKDTYEVYKGTEIGDTELVENL